MSTKMNTNPFATYTSPNGLAYRVTGIEKVEGSERWINGILKYHWITSICFIESKEVWDKLSPLQIAKIEILKKLKFKVYVNENEY